jgi:histidinol phosphatase-like enzyme (inositol monophosphatase family)
MPINNATLMQAAAEVARVAGDVANRYFRAAIETEFKSDGSPVTIADREAEQAARDWLARRFSSDAILGEEFGGAMSGARRAWIIDPIDGTKTFIRGVPLWGTLVGVSVGPDVVAGAAYFPALGELLSAGIGEGCWWNGARARVSDVATLGDATIVTTDEQFKVAPEYRDRWAQLAGRTSISRSWGDCYGYLLVATGRAEVMTDGRVSAWDVAALYPAITEAGGVFTDWNGSTTPLGGSAIASNAALADDVRAILVERRQ